MAKCQKWIWLFSHNAAETPRHLWNAKEFLSKTIYIGVASTGLRFLLPPHVRAASHHCVCVKLVLQGSISVVQRHVQLVARNQSQDGSATQPRRSDHWGGKKDEATMTWDVTSLLLAFFIHITNDIGLVFSYIASKLGGHHHLLALARVMRAHSVLAHSQCLYQILTFGLAGKIWKLLR